MSNAIAGTVTLTGPNGKISVKGSVTASFWDSEKESLSGVDGVHGYKKTFVAPFIEVTASTTSELNINEIVLADNETIQIDMANGKTGLLNSAWLTTRPELSPEEGEVTLRWEGKSGSYYTT